jgi:4-alpha-glucanotransferase
VPPDYFSETGQRWGNPLYRWDRMRKTGYAWWIERFRATLAAFDAVRLDHFIGFTRYWAIPGNEPTAINGRWRRGPGPHFFKALRRALRADQLPLIAEDLGVVTPAVRALRDAFGLPGIKILQFAFGTDPNAADFLPHNYPRNAVVYTGTHDNDTVRGWYESLPSDRRALVDAARPGRHGEVWWDLIALAFSSPAQTAMVQAQDVLGLGSDARMNTPGTAKGAWQWGLDELPSAAVAARLRAVTEEAERLA